MLIEMLKKLFILAAFGWIKLLRSEAATRGVLLQLCLKKRTLAQVFSSEFCEISKNTFFTERLQPTASVRFKKILCTRSRSRLVQTRHYYLL